MSWSAKQYVTFEDERIRPVPDLVAALPATEARTVIDLGCGPGNSTEVLAARFPAAELRGLDSSPDMIAAARQRLPRALFSIGGREVAADAPWAPVLAEAAAARTPIGDAVWYYELLRPVCSKVAVWRTPYYQPLAGGPSAIVEWSSAAG